jgi:hypothetical protein
MVQSLGCFARHQLINTAADATSTSALRVNLCADEVIVITMDPRTGRLNMRDTGDLAASGRVPKFTMITDAINANPTILTEALMRLRYLVSDFTSYRKPS